MINTISWYWEHLTGLCVVIFFITIFNVIIAYFTLNCWQIINKKMKGDSNGGKRAKNPLE